jgi:hypothetical protein
LIFNFFLFNSWHEAVPFKHFIDQYRNFRYLAFISWRSNFILICSNKLKIFNLLRNNVNLLSWIFYHILLPILKISRPKIKWFYNFLHLSVIYDSFFVSNLCLNILYLIKGNSFIYGEKMYDIKFCTEHAMKNFET